MSSYFKIAWPLNLCRNKCVYYHQRQYFGIFFAIFMTSLQSQNFQKYGG